jgi:hypothetical protein
MILYNITYLVPKELIGNWLKWMKEEHIPGIMKSELFEKNTLLQLMNVDEQDGLTYALQLYAASSFEYDEYEIKFAPALRLKAAEQWGEQVLTFRTLMRIVQ